MNSTPDMNIETQPLSEKLKNKRPVIIGAICAAALFAGLLIFKPDAVTSLAEIVPLELPALSEDVVFASLSDNESLAGDIKSIKLKPGDSLGPVLMRNGVAPNEAYNAMEAFATAYNPRDLRAGQLVTLYFDKSAEPQLTEVTLKPSFDRTVFVSRDNQGEYRTRDLTVNFPKEIVQVSGTVENSLYLDAGRMGVPDKVTGQFSHIYEHSVDFQRDIRKGDAFIMAFELYRDAQGNPLKAGDLLYASFSPRGKTSSYYLYTTQDGSENFFDADGKSAKRKLMRTPVNGARLSSGYGRRKHPVLGYVKTHKGVDFAAPRGTPIMAAGIGTVERANRYGSFGNYVRIRHSDGYKTAYAHMKSFARGIRSGSRVRQGQTIGYVGTTGRSTGPHLHYEVHKGGKAINPRSLSTLSGKPLPSAEKAAFDARRKEIDDIRLKAGPVFAGQEPALRGRVASITPADSLP
ncbi:M23 family metallopeptidase [Robiginitomaculum antarcticum]|uniref:M23 family metallopeptidase n=1 Tax=Robiginitomaculum antarcticum TaxID=437507 RepID=UPI00039BDB95|nr:M23 family metallopeptidase [Robiginitomaculum antarcticum]